MRSTLTFNVRRSISSAEATEVFDTTDLAAGDGIEAVSLDLTTAVSVTVGLVNREGMESVSLDRSTEVSFTAERVLRDGTGILHSGRSSSVCDTEGKAILEGWLTITKRSSSEDGSFETTKLGFKLTDEEGGG